jgi:hypothetical protein
MNNRVAIMNGYTFHGKRRKMLRSTVIAIAFCLMTFQGACGLADDTTPPPSIPFRVEGMLTVNAFTIPSNAALPYFPSAYVILANCTDSAGNAFIIGSDTIGLGKSTYRIDISFNPHPDYPQMQLSPGDQITLRAFKLTAKGCIPLSILTPKNGAITVGSPGFFSQIDIISEIPPSDVNNDLKIGLHEAVHALQVLSGNR